MAEKTARMELIDQLAAELQKVEAVTSKNSLVMHPLYIEGQAFPKIWLPAYLAEKMRQDNYDPGDRCGKQKTAGIGAGHLWTCDRESEHSGNHIALFLESTPEAKDDQILEIWSRPNRRALGLSSDDVLYVEGEPIPYIVLPDITVPYQETGLHLCGQADKETYQEHGHKWICTLPSGHKCSHIAGNSFKTISVWQKV